MKFHGQKLSCRIKLNYGRRATNLRNPNRKAPLSRLDRGIKRSLYLSKKSLSRLDRLKLGNFGDCKSVGEGIYELRIHYGPGIRVYYSRIGSKIVLLLCGGEKSSQKRDIKNAQELFKEYKAQKD